MAAQGRVIVVDDDAEMRALIQRYLGENGLSVRAVPDGASLTRALAREPADVVVLDLMMPGEDGLAVCRRLRAAGDQTPIIMLTARGDPVDRVLGLEMGADDYLAKPFLPRELLARIGALMRRRQASPLGLPMAGSVAFGPFVLDFDRLALTRDGERVDLTTREFVFLKTLVAHAGRPLSRAQLIELAIGRDAEVTDRAVDVQIARLRKAIGDDPDAPVWIRTVWGHGYVFAKPGDGP
ncbi:response regulator [Oharaeibacter diazotrophicus]|uniref:Two-component system phosphate regulon response regulator OmpR n=1 Tax=Oharaeibacter diazotrophicus TaxID=1920512 RepID=A0A4R6RAL4_9HYPH|nr:response regulator [Oharaeibacter diazotrophicus]TDP82676.1 two-component system phosphate regulon response regulator OmpR [Oharaeibacter diazotrophicus]BBE72562.1 transcriptional regulatory protein OmpR [Pleomorphomonas sp. SM30]GLS76592.1 DNA-binding response regulator [Oharaeibacter diazotrophicus]